MISLNLSSVKEKQIESERLANAMNDFWKRPGGSFQLLESFQSKPRPARRNWIDPETVLKRKPPRISAAERKRLRQMTESI
ncbi:hypothetical protein [Pseudomonas sp. NFACC02]|uniref:hypothetical protein n=1 Tax=Pseudomonas sp. NFACC02 TaxID=1566250 RepID=UPI000B8304CE|nr:hypothetical protein [Pseudomonas sp. NFACC02]